VDVGAIPATLFESEMFGHEKGAFTDAKETRVGKFELANKGTLFLDEIGNLPPDLQVKLLSVLQTRSITRVGSNRSIALDVRVICATNAPLYERVKSGAFRQDLFYRLKTIEVHLPPLRERTEDIPALSAHYFQLYCKRYSKTLDIRAGLFDELCNYSWPGNIRELQHAIERAVILCRDSVVTRTDFQLAPSISEAGLNSNSLNLSEMEREVIRKAIQKSNNNLTRAAEELGIGRTTLYRKIEEYGLGTLEK
jgi:DNA-binding NtrC family response regulator